MPENDGILDDQREAARPGPLPVVDNRGSEHPEPRHPAAAAEDPWGPGEGTLLIGPSQAGKTALLVSFGRACHFRERGEARMKFVPEKLGENDTAKLMQHGPEFVFGRKSIAEATQRVLLYPFTITVTGGPERLNECLRFRVTDGPGGAIFSAEMSQRAHFNLMVESGLKAKNLIICADVAAPELDKFELFFNDYIQALTEGDTKLHFDTVLILLTKVDLLVHAYDFSVGNDWNVALDHRDLAGMISPVRQAKEVLGPVVLQMIHAALKDEARMAVGLCSALGFDAETGGAFVDSATGEIRRGELETPSDMLKRWQPFGIRDAVYFLAGGGAYGSVELYTEEDTYVDKRGFSPDLGRGQQ